MPALAHLSLSMSAISEHVIHQRQPQMPNPEMQVSQPARYRENRCHHSLLPFHLPPKLDDLVHDIVAIIPPPVMPSVAARAT